jgi:CRP-like cAMP-binding protein
MDLHRMALFRGLNNDEISDLLVYFEQKQYATTDKIVSAGDPGGGLFLIVSGKINVKVGGKVIVTLEPGEVFGEVSLLDEQPRTATIFALTDVMLMNLSREAFARMKNDEAAISMQLVTNIALILCHRIRSANEVIVEELRQARGLERQAEKGVLNRLRRALNAA